MKFASRFMWLTTLCVGATGGLLASLVGWPLPWVIGSLVLIIIVRCCGWLVPEIPEGRKVGQLIVAIVFKRFNLPNPWTFGPFLVCAIVVGGADLHMSMPVWLSSAGQLMVGCALGINFDRSFFRRAPRFLCNVLLLLTGSILATAMMAWLLGQAVDVAWLSLALGMMPGSAPEMSLTAAALNLSVTLVTAMQILRMIFIQAATLPLYRLSERWGRRCAPVAQ